MTLPLAVLACLAALVSSAPPPGPPGIPIVLAQAPTGGEREPEARNGRDLAPGSRIVVFDPAAPDQGVRNLTPGFAAAGRPNVSFDGRRILFVARRLPGEPLAVFEMGADGSDPRKIVAGETSCTAAIHIGTLFTIDGDRPRPRLAFLRGSLYTCDPAGHDVQRITFHPGGVSDPVQLLDGRLVLALPHPGAEGHPTALFSMNPDGTDLFPFAALHEPPATRGMPCETPDGWVVYVESPPGAPGDDAGGALVAVRRARSLHSRRLLDDGAPGAYLSPAPLPDGRLLVSWRPGPGASYGIHIFDPRSKTRAAAVLDHPDLDEIDAVPLAPRAEPAGRSSLVDPARTEGSLYCLDVRITDAAGAGGGAARPPRSVRVLARGAAGEILLGEAPLEPDGSFFVRVPARTPLRLETVGRDGTPVRRMRSWVWVMPGESRGCIGCHEDRERTPPNRQPLALQKPPHPIGPADLRLDGPGAKR